MLLNRALHNGNQQLRNVNESITEDYPYETLYYVGANIRYRPRYFMHVPNNPPSFNSQLEHFKKI